MSGTRFGDQLKGQVAVVTGGGQGLGRAVARALAQRGADVVIAARRRAVLEATAAELAADVGARVVPVVADTTDTGSVQALAQAAAAVGQVTILVNGAAAPAGLVRNDIAAADPEALLADLDTKVVGYFRCIKALAPLMRANHYGRVVNIGGLTGRSSHALSGMRNVAIVHLTKTLSDQLGPDGITVNTLHPGVVESEHIHDLYGYLAKQFTVFGQHIHIGCDSGDTAVRMAHLFSRYIPHFIALSASSPFFQGVDTFFASSRLNSVSAFPLAGHLPFVADWAGFTGYFEQMRELHVVESMKDFYWDIRPKPEFGTIEIRVCDTPLTLERAAALATYARALARYLMEKRPIEPSQDVYRVYGYNRFLACRFGLDAEIIDPQLRAFLENCWETLENAGYDPDIYKGLIGVFGGMSFPVLQDDQSQGADDIDDDHHPASVEAVRGGATKHAEQQRRKVSAQDGHRDEERIARLRGNQQRAGREHDAVADVVDGRRGQQPAEASPEPRWDDGLGRPGEE